MNGEVTILVNKGNTETITYTATFKNCPQDGNIFCDTNRILIDEVTLEPEPPDINALWQMVADQNTTLNMYNDTQGTGQYTVTGFDIDGGYLFFEEVQNCESIAEACYFTFSVTVGSNESTYLDLYPNEVISQNWEFTEISTFTARAPFSREFRVPLTEVNAQVFNAVQLATYSGIDYYNKKLNATIFVDDVPIISGFIRLIRSIVQEGVRTDLELSFYGNTPSLFTVVGQKKLKDIVDLVNLSGEITPAEIITPPSPDLTYALIDRGTNNSLTSENFTGFIAPTVTDYTPCIRWGYLLRNIIKDAGYELEAPDLLAELDTVYMPWIGQTPFAISQALGGAHIYFQTDANMETYDAGNTSVSIQFSNFVPGNWFLASLDPLSYINGIGWGPYPGGSFQDQYIEYSAWATFDYPYNTATSIRLTALVTVGPSTAGALSFDVATLEIPANSPGTYYLGGTINFYLPSIPGFLYDTIGFRLSSSAGWGGSNLVYLYEGSPDYAFTGTGYAIGTRYVKDSNLWDFDAIGNAPDFTQVQFLTDVLNMFNCAVIQDRLINNKIKIVPMANYLGSGLTDDWSDYLAYDKDIVIRSAAEFLKAKLVFTYSAGGDYYSKYYVDNAKRIYGNYEVIGYVANPTDTPNEFAQGTQEIKLTTQSTPSAIFPGTSIPTPRFIDASGNYASPGMRALYLADTLYPPHSLPVRIMGHYNSLLPEANDLDLNFAPESPLHPIQANPINNLFTRYWRDYLNELYSPQARIMEAYFNINLGDVLNFDFSNKYFINDSYWRVLKISDYKIGSGELTKVTLIKILNLNLSDCNLEVDRSLPDGSYTWTFDGDPVPGTLACCNKIGGTWDATNEKCYGRKSSNLVGDLPPININSNGQTPRDSIVKTENYSGGLDTVYQVAVGKNITDLGSDYSLLVGRDLSTDITPDSGIMGRNALVKNTGFHFGGGYRAGVGNPGTMQAGTIVLSNTNVFNANGASVVLSIGNDSVTHIDLPNDTQWLVTIDLIATDLAGFWIYSKTSTSFLDVAGTGVATPVNIITTDDSGAGALNILPVIDVVSTPGLFKVWAQVNTIGAFTYPTPAVVITATVNYIQAR